MGNFAGKKRAASRGFGGGEEVQLMRMMCEVV